MLNSRYLLSSTQRAQSKNSNLSHHQQRGIVTNLPLAFYGICPKLYSSILFLKSNLIFSWWSAQLSQPDGHFPWISQPDWKIWNWLCGGRTCIELCRGWPGTSRHHLPPPSMYLHPPSSIHRKNQRPPYTLCLYGIRQLTWATWQLGFLQTTGFYLRQISKIADTNHPPHSSQPLHTGLC